MLTPLFCRLCTLVEGTRLLSFVKSKAFLKAVSSLLAGQFLKPSFRITNCSNRNVASIAFMVAVCCFYLYGRDSKCNRTAVYLKVKEVFLLYCAREAILGQEVERRLNYLQRNGTPFILLMWEIKNRKTQITQFKKVHAQFALRPLTWVAKELSSKGGEVNLFL
jgi:hypothetical protein